MFCIVRKIISDVLQRVSGPVGVKYGPYAHMFVLIFLLISFSHVQYINIFRYISSVCKMEWSQIAGKKMKETYETEMNTLVD